MWTGFSGGCLKPPDKTDRDGKQTNDNVGECFYNVHLLKLNLPFVVESVSAVDGSNVSGVIEEVRTNGAVCSDRHLRHGNEAVRIGTKKKMNYCFWRRYSLCQTPHMYIDYPVVSLTK